MVVRGWGESVRALGPQRARYQHPEKLHLLCFLHRKGLSDISLYFHPRFAAKQGEHQPLGAHYRGRGPRLWAASVAPQHEQFAIGTFSTLCVKKQQNKTKQKLLYQGQKVKM